jgi:hypothetical protein
MANKKRRQTKKPESVPSYTLRYGKKTIHFILDKVLIFRLMRSLRGRFWGVAGLGIMILGFSVCFAIRPDMRSWSTAFSDFGSDVKTAPYLAASLFFGAYGLWRWRNYLRRTLKRSRPIITFVDLTVLGLYIAALMPVAWEPWPYRIHMFGVTMAGLAAAATVVADTALSKIRPSKSLFWWRALRFIAFVLIIVGGYITFGSATIINWYEYALLGEVMILAGYGLWIVDKTYRGEGTRSQLSKALHKVVLID